MKKRIIIAEERITKAGEHRLFQIRLPKNTKRIIGVSTDLRIETAFLADPAGVPGDAIWNLNANPLAGRLTLQSMEKANIFFQDYLWVLLYNDGISDLDKMDSMDAFSVYTNKEPKAVNVPCNTTIINALYKDALGVTFDSDFVYRVKVTLWTEYDENEN